MIFLFTAFIKLIECKVKTMYVDNKNEINTKNKLSIISNCNVEIKYRFWLKNSVR